jgi:hypothetical protein
VLTEETGKAEVPTSLVSQSAIDIRASKSKINPVKEYQDL